jgi:hypothetical protein
MSYWSGRIAQVLNGKGIPTLDWADMTAGLEVKDHCHLAGGQDMQTALGKIFRLLVVHASTHMPVGWSVATAAMGMKTLWGPWPWVTTGEVEDCPAAVTNNKLAIIIGKDLCRRMEASASQNEDEKESRGEDVAMAEPTGDAPRSHGRTFL